MIRLKSYSNYESSAKLDNQETREFGIGRDIRRGIANKGKQVSDYFNGKRGEDKTKYKAGVVYLKAVKNENSISYTLHHEFTKACESTSEANKLVPELIEKIWAKNDDTGINGDEKGNVMCYPIIKMKAVAEDTANDEIKMEEEDARKSSMWQKLLEPRIKTINS